MAITLIIETGQGVPNANAYIDEAYAASYFELQGSDLWCDNSDKQALALVQASQFVDLRYGKRFCGTPVSADQGLAFPRMVKGTNTGIPKAFKNAVAQLALQYLTDGSLDLNANADAAVQQETVSVGNGAVQESRTYFNETGRASFSFFAAADRTIDQALRDAGCASNISFFIPAERG